MTKKMWGGRFAKNTDPLVEEFTKSIHYDYKIGEYDCLGSMAHVAILKKSSYLTASEANKLLKALTAILESIKNGSFKPDNKSEDIHTNIQNLLQVKVGGLALKLHTARSRNDQVAFAAKLYCKENIESLKNTIIKLQICLKDTALKYKDIIIPGFTHMQHAQPVYLKDYFTAYSEMLERDKNSLSDISKNIKLTLGAGALAGTPINARNYALSLAKLLKGSAKNKAQFSVAAVLNSLDAVSDRDFVIEVISALSILSMHLSRLAEDLIIWSTKEFDFIEIDESFCTGSSLMPQKKNPDALELIRGNCARIYGNLVSVLTMMKGLPLTYNRDMQLDKEPLFNSIEIALVELKIMAGIIKTLRFNRAKIAQQLTDESLYATDMVYYLVNKKVPFKEAHIIIGRLVRYSLENSIAIRDMPEARFKGFSDKLIKKDIVALLDPKVSVESKKSIRRTKP